MNSTADATHRQDAEAEIREAALTELRSMVSACMQCGTCTATCPNSESMDLTPRRMWRALLFGDTDMVLQSKSFYLCSSCYACTLRCPRGLPLTRAMAGLKRFAARENNSALKKKGAFYRVFTDNIRRYGRVQETALMTRYFIAARDPALPFAYTPLGLKLMRKGKLHPVDRSGAGKLEAIFNKVEQMEGRP